VDLESAILRELERFLLELGAGFAFVERQPSEEPPLGIILCAGKKRETVEYLDLDVRGIHVAEYLTELPAREVLEERLRRAIEAARNRLALDSDLNAQMSGKAPFAKRHRGRGRRKT
jgi:hypothetical protein